MSDLNTDQSKAWVNRPCQPSFRDELQRLINEHSREGRSNTPDYVLAGFMASCLTAFEMGVIQRDNFYGVTLVPGQPVLVAELQRRNGDNIPAPGEGKAVAP